MKLLCLVLIALAAAAIADDISVMPLPQNVQSGQSVVALNPATFKCIVSSTKSRVLNEACDRLVKQIFPFTKFNERFLAADVVLPSVTVKVDDYTDDMKTLAPDMPESYSLYVPNSGAGATITAKNVWGALRGLQTFQQLVQFSTKNKLTSYFIANATLNINDFPRFNWRGILIDSSRHFLPMHTILNMVDAMSAAKFNVLHWHIVDAVAYPLQSEKFPDMTKGAYAEEATYSLQDVRDVVEYCWLRGIRVVIEMDMPGHAYSWGVGYKITASCPAYERNVNNLALDPSNELTFTIVNGLLNELATVLPDSYVHLGGDEIVYKCWLADDRIVNFMKQKGLATPQALEDYFYSRVFPTLAGNGRTPMFWQEVFAAGVNMPKNSIVEVWMDAPTIASVVKAGKKAVSSYAWYLDVIPNGSDHMQLQNTWRAYYDFDPVNTLASYNLTNEQKLLIVGGEACMWAEQVDEYSIMDRVWPRAAAIGERLWSDAKVTDKTSAQTRMINWRCRTAVQQMNLNVGPIQPDYCPRP